GAGHESRPLQVIQPANRRRHPNHRLGDQGRAATRKGLSGTAPRGPAGVRPVRSARFAGTGSAHARLAGNVLADDALEAAEDVARLEGAVAGPDDDNGAAGLEVPPVVAR